jgi:glucokinase
MSASLGSPHDVAIAIDIGATKLAVALVDPAGNLSHHEVGPTRPADPDGADRVWPDLGEMVDRMLKAATEEERQVAGVGVGSAGPLDLTVGAVSPVNIPSWRGFPLLEQLSRRTGLPVRLAGDGICAAIGEHWLGAARGRDDVMVVVVSTGVGGGVIQNGRLQPGHGGNAGHIGHMVVDFDGDPCPCGGRGCVEAMASGPAMVRWARRQDWAGGDSAKELAADARAGNPIATAAFERGARALAAGLTALAAACDLRHAVIGGGVSRAGDVLLPPLRVAIDEYARLDFLRGLGLSVAELGGEAGLYGAAALILDPHTYPASPGGQP